VTEVTVPLLEHEVDLILKGECYIFRRLFVQRIKVIKIITQVLKVHSKYKVLLKQVKVTLPSTVFTKTSMVVECDGTPRILNTMYIPCES
jgi:hypothetical protein